MTQVRPLYCTAHLARHRGFTIIELVVVILITGILVATAAGRLMDRNVMDSRTFADQGGALLRYAQKMAISQNRDVWVVLAPGGIKLCYTKLCAPADRVPAPGGFNSESGATSAFCASSATWACEAPSSGVTLGATLNFYFDPVGKPFGNLDVSPTSVSSFGSALAVQVQSPGLADRVITVEAETGYVH